MVPDFFRNDGYVRTNHRITIPVLSAFGIYDHGGARCDGVHAVVASVCLPGNWSFALEL